jgi:hypothetical protein
MGSAYYGHVATDRVEAEVPDPYEAREQRLAINETLFRDLNELIAGDASSDEDRSSFICECANLNCQLRLKVTLEEYAGVRANKARFLVFPGHEKTEVEKIVGGSPPRYTVVEKIGGGRDVAGA